MENFNLINIFAFGFFTVILGMQAENVKHFRNTAKFKPSDWDEAFPSLLNLSNILGVLIGITYLIYYGISVVWWAPFVLFLIAGVFQKIFGAIKTPYKFFICRIGIIIWPLLAFLMFYTIPLNS
ncbi:MAG: hypothetical protein CL530_03450 [Aequorivita sp.]|nr:hypothetical protein [Aequorivita sp.]